MASSSKTMPTSFENSMTAVIAASSGVQKSHSLHSGINTRTCKTHPASYACNPARSNCPPVSLHEQEKRQKRQMMKKQQQQPRAKISNDTKDQIIVAHDEETGTALRMVVSCPKCDHCFTITKQAMMTTPENRSKRKLDSADTPAAKKAAVTSHASTKLAISALKEIMNGTTKGSE